MTSNNVTRNPYIPYMIIKKKNIKYKKTNAVVTITLYLRGDVYFIVL